MSTALIVFAVIGFLIFAVMVVRAALLPVTAQPAEIPSAISLRAVRNLLSEGEDRFVRARLPVAEYRRLQRKKCRVAREYAAELSRYASGMAQLGQAARSSSDPEVVLAANQLVATALRLRAMALLVRTYLVVDILFPSARPYWEQLVRHFHRVEDAAAHLASARSRLGAASLFQ